MILRNIIGLTKKRIKKRQRVWIYLGKKFMLFFKQKIWKIKHSCVVELSTIYLVLKGTTNKIKSCLFSLRFFFFFPHYLCKKLSNDEYSLSYTMEFNHFKKKKLNQQFWSNLSEFSFEIWSLSWLWNFYFYLSYFSLPFNSKSSIITYKNSLMIIFSYKRA